MLWVTRGALYSAPHVLQCPVRGPASAREGVSPGRVQGGLSLRVGVSESVVWEGRTVRVHGVGTLPGPEDQRATPRAPRESESTGPGPTRGSLCRVCLR